MESLSNICLHSLQIMNHNNDHPTSILISLEMLSADMLPFALKTIMTGHKLVLHLEVQSHNLLKYKSTREEPSFPLIKLFSS